LAGNIVQWISVLFVWQCGIVYGIYVKVAKLSEHLTLHHEQHESRADKHLCEHKMILIIYNSN
jgi:hypothetical protein